MNTPHTPVTPVTAGAAALPSARPLWGTSPQPPAGMLVCTDFSPAADQALARACALAASPEVALTALHVVASGGLDALRQWLQGHGEWEQRLVADALARLQAQCDALQRPGTRTQPVQCQVRSGTLIAEIKAAVQALQPELVLLGARGESDFARLALGTTAERLLRRSHRPLLVVRQPADRPYRRVLVPVDFSPWTAITLQAVKRWAPTAHTVLLHAWSLPFDGQLAIAGVDADTVAHYRQRARLEAEQWLHHTAREHGLVAGQWTPSLVMGDASHAIVEQVQHHDCDLVAMGKHGRHAAEELLLGSVCKHVLAEVAVDVLVVNAPEQHPPSAPPAPPAGL